MGFHNQISVYLGFLFPKAMHNTKVYGTDWFMKLKEEGMSPENYDIPNTDNKEFVFSIMHSGSKRELVATTDWLFKCIEEKGREYYDYQRKGLTMLLSRKDYEVLVKKSFSSTLSQFDEQVSKSSLVGENVVAIYVTKKNMSDFCSSLESHYRSHYSFDKPPTGRPTITALTKKNGSSSQQHGHQPHPQPHPHPHGHGHGHHHHGHHHPHPPAPVPAPAPAPYYPRMFLFPPQFNHHFLLSFSVSTFCIL
jgi:hypothetical protein